MEIVITPQDQFNNMEILGRIDATTAPEFDNQFNEFFANETEHKSILIDLSKVEYLSSAGLRSILKIAKQLTGVGKKLVICEVQPPVYEVFKISGFTAILKVVGTHAEAEALLK